MHKRLSPVAVEWINREQKLQFEFEGHPYTAYVGDSITSALWAAGERTLGRSFKYHRPRGILSLANHDVNILMQDGQETHIRADVTPVQAGMQLQSVNTGGQVKTDSKRWLDWISPLLPVGFYYKAFYKPKRLFPFWEKLIRRSAGLGELNTRYIKTAPRKQHVHCDVLVIGAGAAGMSAALEAACAGCKVILVDENAQIGGSLAYDCAGDETQQVLQEAMRRQILQHPHIQRMTQSYAAGYYSDRLIPMITPQGMQKVRAKTVIVASGAFEQPPVFRNNDLPGVMLGSAAQRLVYRYATAPFTHGLIFTANDYGYRVALDLLARGVGVHTLVDMREVADSQLSKAVRQKGVEILFGQCVYAALPSANKLGIKAAQIAPIALNKETGISKVDSSKIREIPCDGIAMSAGWSPAAALLYQAGVRMYYDDQIEQFRPQQLPHGLFAAGKVNGIFGLDARIQDGKRAAHQALQVLGLPAKPLSVEEKLSASPSHPFPMVPHPAGKNFIDFDEDIQLKDFYNAAQEGFNNIELMKRYTTVGMGPSQGKHANMNAIRVLADIRQLPIEKVGTTTARPFYHPTPMGHLAGRSVHLTRQTAVHAYHQAVQAEMVTVGAWTRPAYYPMAGKTAQACVRAEVKAVREKVGILDAGTLGKIEVRGKDAALFLERFYTGEFKTLRVGRTRYALAVDESGVILDDGVVARLGQALFYVTTSTANAANVYREMQRWQQQWQLDIGLVNVTSAYQAMNVAGPHARTVLQQSLKQTALPAMALGDVQQFSHADTLVRIMRLGFVSAEAYEIHVPSSQGMTVWCALLEAGKAYGIQAFGTEAQRILRLELGHLITGHDTDGLTHPYEAGLAFALAMHKPFFVGQRSLRILQQKQWSKQLVGFVLTDPAYAQSSAPPLYECNLVIDQGEIAGRITSISLSPTLGKVIGLAYVSAHLAAVGTPLQFRTDTGEYVVAQVTPLPFLPIMMEAVA